MMRQLMQARALQFIEPKNILFLLGVVTHLLEERQLEMMKHFTKVFSLMNDFRKSTTDDELIINHGSSLFH